MVLKISSQGSNPCKICKLKQQQLLTHSSNDNNRIDRTTTISHINYMSQQPTDQCNGFHFSTILLRLVQKNVDIKSTQYTSRYCIMIYCGKSRRTWHHFSMNKICSTTTSASTKNISWMAFQIEKCSRFFLRSYHYDFETMKTPLFMRMYSPKKSRTFLL